MTTVPPGGGAELNELGGLSPGPRCPGGPGAATNSPGAPGRRHTGCEQAQPSPGTLQRSNKTLVFPSVSARKGEEL